MQSRVVVITPPAAIVSLDAAKAHLRVDDGAEDTLIQAMVAAAEQHIDGPAGWLGRAIGRQTLELRRNGFPDCGGWVQLPYPPAVSITEVTYDDPAGASQTVAPADYTLYGEALAHAPAAAWPATADNPESARIRYLAGYETVPAPIVAAIKLMVGDLWRFRDGVVQGQVAEVPMSTTVAALLAPYRVWRL
jgi:uncharacterized phiE125 gp8 family phage protein